MSLNKLETSPEFPRVKQSFMKMLKTKLLAHAAVRDECLKGTGKQPRLDCVL